MALQKPHLLEPVTRLPVNEAVYRRLRDHLMRGDYLAGQVLGIQDTANALNTSMMPVREALRRLAAQRALEPMKSRSMRVPLMSPERLEDIWRTRLLIEGAAIERATARIDAAGIRTLRGLAQKIGVALGTPNRVAAGLEQNQVFHFTLYEYAESPTMLAIIESLWLQSGPYLRAARELMHSPARPSRATHDSIVEALERRDAAAARAALELDISWAFDRLRTAEPVPALGGL